MLPKGLDINTLLTCTFLKLTIHYYTAFETVESLRIYQSFHYCFPKAKLLKVKICMSACIRKKNNPTHEYITKKLGTSLSLPNQKTCMKYCWNQRDRSSL